MALTTNTSGAIGKAATKTAVAKKDPTTGMRAYIAKMEGGDRQGPAQRTYPGTLHPHHPERAERHPEAGRDHASELPECDDDRRPAWP